MEGTSNQAYVGEEDYRIQDIDEDPVEDRTEMNRQEPENGRASVRTTEEEKQEPWDRATKTLDENKSKMSSAVPHHLRICIKRSFQVIFFLFALIFSFANTVSTTKNSPSSLETSYKCHIFRFRFRC